MHYKDGTEAMVGDIVRGKGFNILHEIIAPVTKLKSDGGTCNLEIQWVKPTFHKGYDDGDFSQVGPNKDGWIPEHWTFDIVTEYGDVSQFELVAREGWALIQSKKLVWEKIKGHDFNE